MVLLVGATHPLMPALVAEVQLLGEKPRLLVMPEEQRHIDRSLHSIEKTVASLSDRPALSKAVEGCRFVISGATAYQYAFSQFRPKWISVSRKYNLETIDIAGHKTLMEICANASVERVIYLSNLFADPTAGVRLLRVNYDVEQLFKNSGLNFVCIRLADLMEVEILPLLELGKSGKLKILSSPDAHASPLAAVDAAAIVSKSLTFPVVNHQVLSIGGPEQLSWRQIVQSIATKIGRNIDLRQKSTAVLRKIRMLKRLTGGNIGNTYRFGFDQSEMLLYVAKNERAINMQATGNLLQVDMTPLSYWLQDKS